LSRGIYLLKVLITTGTAEFSRPKIDIKFARNFQFYISDMDTQIFLELVNLEGIYSATLVTHIDQPISLENSALSCS